ncbi:MAG: hypothetical protein AB7I72_22185, partial [Parvibaculaceae bacterium]
MAISLSLRFRQGAKPCFSVRFLSAHDPARCEMSHIFKRLRHAHNKAQQHVNGDLGCVRDARG